MAHEFTEFSRRLSPETYCDLKRSLELGRWPDGRALTTAQRELCMQAIISYEHAHVPEQQRTGYMEHACKRDRESRGVDTIDIVARGDDA